MRVHITALLLSFTTLTFAAPQNQRQLNPLNPPTVKATPGPQPPPFTTSNPPAPDPKAIVQFPYPPPKCTQASVRVEWRTLSNTQKANWIAAVKCLAKKPHSQWVTANGLSAGAPPVNSNSTIYDDFSFVHMDYATQVHLTGFFFTWHRHYVASYDQALRTLCSYKGPTPYWDWSKDSGVENFQASAMFADTDPTHGLGSWGNPADDWTVDSGAFANDFWVAYPFRHRIRRQFTQHPFDFPFFPAAYQLENGTDQFRPSEMSYMVNNFEGDFPNFQHYFEKLWAAHGSVHGSVGGDLNGVCGSDAPPGVCTTIQFSPNEPMFWLHHANVDRVWWAWQHKNPAKNFWTFAGGSVPSAWAFNETTTEPNGAGPPLFYNSSFPTDLVVANARVQDVIDTQGGYYCYTYDNDVFG